MLFHIFCRKDFAIENVTPVYISTPVNGFKTKANMQILLQV